MRVISKLVKHIAICTISAHFIFIPCLIAIPYYLSIYNIGLLNSYFESISGYLFPLFITFWSPFCHTTQLLVTCLSQFHLLVTQHQTTQHDTIAHNTTQDNTTHHNTSTSRHKATQGTTNSWPPCCSKTMQDRSFLNAILGEGGVIQRWGREGV